MATAPPSFSGPGPQIAKLPQPGNPAAPLSEGLSTLAEAVSRATASGQASDDQVRESNLQVARLQRERAVQLATGDAAAHIADLQGALSTDLIGLRQHAQPGAAGYEEQVDERIGKFRDAATAYLGNSPDLVARLGDNIALIGANARTEEYKWAATQRAGKSLTDTETLQSSLQGNIRTAVANGTANDQMLADADRLDAAAIGALPIPGNDKTKLTKERHDERLVTAIEATTDVNPHAVIENIDKGVYGELDDKVVAQLRERARVAADRIDNKALQAANEQAAVGRAQAGNLIEDVNAGTHVETATLQGYLAQVQGSQKPEDIRLAHDLTIAVAKNEVTAKYDNSTNDERLAAVHAIEGHKGWQADEQLTAAHAQLQTLIGRDSQEAEHDAISLYSRQTGQDLPPLNLADPAAMSRRFLLGDRAGDRFNKPPAYLTAQEAGDMRQQFNSGTPQAKAQLIEQLGGFGPDRARTIMRQIAPDNGRLARLTELSAYADPAIRVIVGEALDGSAQPMKEGTAAAVRSLAMRQYGEAMARMPGDRLKATLEVATDIYAHRAAAAAKAGSFDPQTASDAVAAAFGSANGKGGFGRARNGAAMILPAGVSQRDFDTIWSAANGAQIVNAANGGAYWRTGQHLTDADLKQLTPVLIRDDGVTTRYAFRSKGGSGYVKTQRGDDFVLDFRQLMHGVLHP